MEVLSTVSQRSNISVINYNNHRLQWFSEPLERYHLHVQCFLAAEFKCGGGSYKADDVFWLKRAIKGQPVVTASWLVQKRKRGVCGLILPHAESTVVSTCSFSPIYHLKDVKLSMSWFCMHFQTWLFSFFNGLQTFLWLTQLIITTCRGFYCIILASAAKGKRVLPKCILHRKTKKDRRGNSSKTSVMTYSAHYFVNSASIWWHNKRIHFA